MELARRERERAERERRQAEKSAREAQPVEAQKKQEAVSGQTVIVRVFVDDQGRVSQATVANSRPGMEAYEASALRIARQRRYPSGKSGWVTVPIKFN
ncbi:TonB family protein [Pyrinomonas sp.]|uniref:TonB family protein n=1 Tax=Pyrinomonas sp. TaxID=2080306 RepID=UPI00332A827C